MLGIDTNILVRFLVRDDESQLEKARRLIRREIVAGHRVFVSQLILLETECVLRSRYGLQKIEIIKVVSGLLDANDVHSEDEAAVEEALFVWNDNAVGFTDCIIGARNKRLECSATATFDVKAFGLPGFVSAWQPRNGRPPAMTSHWKKCPKADIHFACCSEAAIDPTET